MNLVLKSCAAIRVLIVAGLLVCATACGKPAPTGKPRFEGIEQQPMTREAALVEYKQMVTQMCAGNLLPPGVSQGDCYEHVRKSESICDAESLQRMPQQLSDRQQAIGFAKQYARCAMP